MFLCDHLRTRKKLETEPDLLGKSIRVLPAEGPILKLPFLKFGIQTLPPSENSEHPFIPRTHLFRFISMIPY